MTTANSAKEILKKVGMLPPLPGTAVKLMNVINDPRSTVEDIVETIKYDQAVTGEVLRLCNSAYFGLSRTVTSLNDAMLCLGTVKVLQLVMSVHTNSLLAREQGGYGLEPGILWKHSVAVALAASVIAQRIEKSNVNLVFTASLLHDIGKVVLNEYVAEDFSEIVRRVNEERLSFAEAEQQVLGFAHQEIGGKIAEMWELPEPIIRCIRFHHDPGDLDPTDPLVDIVHVANCVCLLFGIGLGEDGLYCRADSAAMERHGLRESDLEIIGAQMLSELKRVEQLFDDATTTATPGTTATARNQSKARVAT
ncbi:MAG: HDOD domain-containing protein [Phycisphaerae bacterium]|nr:HDOD domain-containing protein [Phycisphaerae bacterium]